MYIQDHMRCGSAALLQRRHHYFTAKGEICTSSVKSKPLNGLLKICHSWLCRSYEPLHRIWQKKTVQVGILGKWIILVPLFIVSNSRTCDPFKILGPPHYIFTMYVYLWIYLLPINSAALRCAHIMIHILNQYDTEGDLAHHSFAVTVDLCIEDHLWRKFWREQ